MKLLMYSIYDTASCAYMRPFVAQSDGQAHRSFSDIATDPNHEVGKHPKDYSLHRIGSFNDQTGNLEPETVPECVVTALEVVSKKHSEKATVPMSFKADNMVPMREADSVEDAHGLVNPAHIKGTQ